MFRTHKTVAYSSASETLLELHETLQLQVVCLFMSLPQTLHGIGYLYIPPGNHSKGMSI